MAEHRHLATPHPQWEKFPHNLPPNTRAFSMTRNRLPITPQPGLDIEEFTISARDSHPIRIRSYRQQQQQKSSPGSDDDSNSPSALPLLIYFHGGGFVTGSLETDDVSCRAIAVEFPCLVLNVEYRLAPEHPFPVGFEDCMDVVRWATALQAQKTLSTNLHQGFILGGTSAGANFAAGIAHVAVQEHLSPPVTGLLLLAGSFCHEDARPKKYGERILSIDEIQESPGLTRKAIDDFAGKYGAPPDDVRRSPVLFESHANLAKRAVFHICGWDPRRDEGLLLEELLRLEGIQTKKYVYPGLPHGFWTTCPDLDVSKDWEKDLLEGVKFLLDREKCT